MQIAQTVAENQVQYFAIKTIFRYAIILLLCDCNVL